MLRSSPFIPPCEPTLRDRAPKGEGWVYEVKFDGYRMQVHKAGLQVAMGAGRQHELGAFAFDLLHRDGVDLRPLPLVQRRHMLERLFERAEILGLLPVPSFNDGMKLLEAAERHGLEGVVSKRRSSAYVSGPSKTWLKVKTASWREANRERWRMFERG